MENKKPTTAEARRAAHKRRLARKRMRAYRARITQARLDAARKAEGQEPFELDAPALTAEATIKSSENYDRQARKAPESAAHECRVCKAPTVCVSFANHWYCAQHGADAATAPANSPVAPTIPAGPTLPPVVTSDAELTLFGKRCAEAFAQAADAHFNLADAYLADGQKELARQYAEKALTLLDAQRVPLSSWSDTEQRRGEIRKEILRILKESQTRAAQDHEIENSFLAETQPSWSPVS